MRVYRSQISPSAIFSTGNNSSGIDGLVFIRDGRYKMKYYYVYRRGRQHVQPGNIAIIKQQEVINSCY